MNYVNVNNKICIIYFTVWAIDTWRSPWCTPWYFAKAFYKKTGKVILSVLLAYMIQLPWLILTDYYLAGLSADFIARLVVVLLLGNVLWAALIQANIVPLRKLFGHKP
mgnify:CR=1 FL=1